MKVLINLNKTIISKLNKIISGQNSLDEKISDLLSNSNTGNSSNNKLFEKVSKFS